MSIVFNLKSKMSKNFIFQDCELLVNIVDKYKSIVENKITNAFTNHKKNEAWKKITEEFNAACLGQKRSTKQIRSKYKHLKHDAGKKLNTDKINIFKTGEDGYNSKVTPLDSKLEAMEVLNQPIKCEFDSDVANDFNSREEEDPLSHCSSNDWDNNDTSEISQFISSDLESSTPPCKQVQSTSNQCNELLLVSSYTQPKREVISPEPEMSANLDSNPETVQHEVHRLSKLTRSSKRKPNASLKASQAIVESSKMKKMCTEAESEQLKKHREEEHVQLMRIREEEHGLQMQILKEKLIYYQRLNKNQTFNNNDLL